MKKIDLLIILSLALLFLASCVDAQRTSRIQRPCPSTATPAVVEVERDGDINITPCSGRTIATGSNMFQVYDPTYTGVLGPTTVSNFRVGSANTQTVTAGQYFVGTDLRSRVDMSAGAGVMSGLTANRVAAVRATTQGANATAGATVTHLIGLDVRHFGSSGTAAFNTITNRYGVYVGNYATTNYEVTNNYGLFLDSTIDELGSTSKFAIYSQAVSTSRFFGKLDFDATYTAGGTTGNQTINKPAFSVNFAAAATSLTVTNSFVTAASVLLCTVQTNDATMFSVAAVASAGSVVLHANAAATAETKVYCEVKN